MPALESGIDCQVLPQPLKRASVRFVKSPDPYETRAGEPVQVQVTKLDATHPRKPLLNCTLIQV